MELNRLKLEFSKKPFLGELRAPDSIDIDKAIKHLLDTSPPKPLPAE